MDQAAQFGVAGAVPGATSIKKASGGKKVRAAAQTTTRAGLAEQFFAVCVLVLSTGAFVNLFPGEQGVENVAQGLLFAQVLWTSLYTLMFLLMRKKIADFVRLIWRQKLLLLLLGWAFLSLVWSINRPVTARHFFALLATSFFGIYLAGRYDLRQQLHLVMISLGVVLVSSAIACIFFPSYGTSRENLLEQPAWQGVLSHKNNLGTLAVLMTLLLALYYLKGIRRWAVAGALFLLLILIVLTQAKTALVYFVLGLLAFPFVRAFQKNRANRRAILGCGLALFGGLGAWTYFYWDSFVGYLGKDPALTGRFLLWGLSLTFIRERPFLGHGFDAFWSDYFGPAADFRMASGWLVAPHAHNGFLNLWLDLGLIGVLLFTIGFAITYRKGLDIARRAKSVEGIWPVTFLTFYLVYSLTEIGFMGRNELFWILYVSVMCGLGSDLMQRSQPTTYERQSHGWVGAGLGPRAKE
jgi:O-antigen ligase